MSLEEKAEAGPVPKRVARDRDDPPTTATAASDPPLVATGIGGRLELRSGEIRIVKDSALGHLIDLVWVTYGVMETIGAVIFILTPPLAGILFERDPMIVYPLSIGLIVLSIVFSYFFSPRKVPSAPAIVSGGEDGA